jgi:hypothetical protein
VDAAYRHRSLELLHRFLNQPGVDLFISTTPNPTAEKVYRAFKFSRVVSGKWDQAGFWITGYRGFAESVLRSAGVPWPNGLAYPLSASLFLRDAVTGPTLPDGGCEFKICSGFDDRFDAFWEELKTENPERLLAERTREALDWHFRARLAKGNVWIIAAESGKRLNAYAIFVRQDHPAIHLTRYRFADFQALRGFEGLLRPALAWMLDRCRREQIHVAESVGGWLEGFRIPGTRAPYHRSLQTWSFYYRARDQDLLHRLQDPNAWAPSSFDGDATL